MQNYARKHGEEIDLLSFSQKAWSAKRSAWKHLCHESLRLCCAVLIVKCPIRRLYEIASFLVGHGQCDQSQKGDCRMRNFELDSDSSNRVLTCFYLYYLSSIPSIHLSLGLEISTLGWPAAAFLLHFCVMVRKWHFVWRSWRCPQMLETQHFTSCLALFAKKMKLGLVATVVPQTWSKRTNVKEMLHQPLQCRFHYFQCFHLDFEDGVYIYGLFIEGKDLLDVLAKRCFGPNLQCNQASLMPGARWDSTSHMVPYSNCG